MSSIAENLVQPSDDLNATAYAIAWQIVTRARALNHQVDPEQIGALVGKVAWAITHAEVKTQPSHAPQYA